jgi:hypothetical protein
VWFWYVDNKMDDTEMRDPVRCDSCKGSCILSTFSSKVAQLLN